MSDRPPEHAFGGRSAIQRGTEPVGEPLLVEAAVDEPNLVGMGVLPLQFEWGDSWESLGLDESEVLDVRGLDDGLDVMDELTVVAERADGSTVEFDVTAQVGLPAAVRYVEHGGILHYVPRRLLPR